MALNMAEARLPDNTLKEQPCHVPCPAEWSVLRVSLCSGADRQSRCCARAVGRPHLECKTPDAALLTLQMLVEKEGLSLQTAEGRMPVQQAGTWRLCFRSDCGAGRGPSLCLPCARHLMFMSCAWCGASMPHSRGHLPCS